MSDPGLPTVIAHRGGSGYAPENTRAAFDRALALGFPDIEFDVRATRDGVPVLLHDATLDRTTNATAVFGPGPHLLADHTLGDVRRLDAGSWFAPEFSGQPIPTLEEVLAGYAGEARFQVEIKTPEVGLEVKLTALMARYGVRAQSVVSSFEVSVVAALAPIGPPLPRWLVHHLDDATIGSALRLGAGGLNVHIDGLSPELAEQARVQGLAIGAWGVETEAQLAHALRCGVDGFTHNYPDVARRQLEQTNAHLSSSLRQPARGGEGKAR